MGNYLNAVKSLRYKNDNGTEMVRFLDEDTDEYVEIEAEKFDKKGKKVMEVTPNNKVDVMRNAKAKFAEWRKSARIMFGTGDYYYILSDFILRELEIIKTEGNDMTEYVKEIGFYIACVIFYHEKENDIDLLSRYEIVVAQHFGIESLISWCEIDDVVFEEVERMKSEL